MSRDQPPPAPEPSATDRGRRVEGKLAAVMGGMGLLGGGATVLAEALYLSHAHAYGLSENTRGGCATALGFFPMLIGGYLFGGGLAFVAVLGLFFGIRSRSRLGIALSALGLIAAVAGVAMTRHMQLDASNW